MNTNQPLSNRLFWTAWSRCAVGIWCSVKEPVGDRHHALECETDLRQKKGRFGVKEVRRQLLSPERHSLNSLLLQGPPEYSRRDGSKQGRHARVDRVANHRATLMQRFGLRNSLTRINPISGGCGKEQLAISSCERQEGPQASTRWTNAVHGMLRRMIKLSE